MSNRARVALVLGDDIIAPHHKDTVIARLINARWTAADREKWYRLWCGVAGVFCSSVDLERVKKGRRRELQRPLPWASKS